MIQYSFIENPIYNLHNYVAELIPGIEKIITIYLNEETKTIESKLSERKKKKYNTSSLNVQEIEERINELRNTRNHFEWYSKNDIPINVNSVKTNSPLTIFAERKNIVLLIKCPNPTDGKNDLIYIYFKENFGNFGLSKDDKWLTTENKTIIAQILSKSIRAYLEDKLTDREVLRANKGKTIQIFSEIKYLKSELEKLRENYGQSMVKLCNQYLIDFSKKYKKTYHFDEGAIEKIKSFKGDLKDLQGIVERSIIFLNNFFFDKALVSIAEWYIDFENMPQSEDQIDLEEVETKYIKTIQLLDKLEKAAKTLKIKKLKLTSVNVGKTLESPISAPAISDALYNHKGKINTLIKDNPEKWLTIRSEFRPLRNIIG